MSDEKTGERGRPGLIAKGGQDEVKHVGIKMPRSLEAKFIAKAKELKTKGFKTNKSELIRTLAEYFLDGAEDIYEEKRKNE